MKRYPPLPRAADAPAEFFDRGHLWIQEKVDGAHFRFQLRESGVLRFGDRRRTYEPDEVPSPYRHAVRYVQRNLDREALRRAVDDVQSVVFFGEATHKQTIEYDWARTPSVLGFDVWSEEKGEFLPPDVVERVFTRLGLQTINAFAKEVRASDFDPESYDIPASAWYDGPPEGVVVRNKTGTRAVIPHPEFEATDPQPVIASAEELAGEYATPKRFRTIAAEVTERGRPATVETLYERALADVLREAHGSIMHEESSVDPRALRSEIAALASRYLEERD